MFWWLAPGNDHRVGLCQGQGDGRQINPFAYTCLRQGLQHLLGAGSRAALRGGDVQGGAHGIAGHFDADQRIQALPDFKHHLGIGRAVALHSLCDGVLVELAGAIPLCLQPLDDAGFVGRAGRCRGGNGQENVAIGFAQFHSWNGHGCPPVDKLITATVAKSYKSG